MPRSKVRISLSDVTCWGNDSNITSQGVGSHSSPHMAVFSQLIKDG